MWPDIFNTLQFVVLDFSYIFDGHFDIKVIKKQCFSGCCGFTDRTYCPIPSPFSSTCMTLRLCPCWFCSAPRTPASLAFVHYCTCWDELEGNPFKCWEQCPCGKKSFSPGRVKGEGGVTPWLLWKQRVTWKTQFSDVIPRRKMLGGLDLFLWEHRGPE